MLPHLNEVQRWVVAGAMAAALGRGGKTAVAEASGLGRNTVGGFKQCGPTRCTWEQHPRCEVGASVNL